MFHASARKKRMGATGKAALARTHSKTCQSFGDSLVREASWIAERSSALAPKQPVEEFCLVPQAHGCD
jgi:hypothetical protein